MVLYMKNIIIVKKKNNFQNNEKKQLQLIIFEQLKHKVHSKIRQIFFFNKLNKNISNINLRETYQINNVKNT